MTLKYWTRNWGPKLATFARALSRIENWPAAVALRLTGRRQGLSLLRFRDGLNVLCRRGTCDWEVVNELAVQDGYGLALQFLRRQPGRPVVLDLGANIGLFSLVAARTHPGAEVVAYEPAPANGRMFELNRLANESLAERITLRREGVGGTTRTVSFTYDPGNPQASGMFYATGQAGLPVQIRAFTEVLASVSGPVALVKMDIEGAEYEILEQTPAEAWKEVQAVTVEIHDDPSGRLDLPRFLERMAALGFTGQTREPVGTVSYFLARP